jgi:hypothetical protein
VVTSAEAPEPPYPADTRAKGWRFELDYERLEQSDTWVLAPADLKPWLLMLWLTAWKQRPAGSLPSSPELVAAQIGMPAHLFSAAQAILLRGWKLHADGRLYHPAMTSIVMAMVETRDRTAERKRTYDQKTKRIRARDGGACVYCGAQSYLTLDHLIPLSRGGSSDDDNLVTSCKSCNSSKGARTPDEARLSFRNSAAAAQWAAQRAALEVGAVLVTRPERGSNAATTPPEPEPVIQLPPLPPSGGAPPPPRRTVRTAPAEQGVDVAAADPPARPPRRTTRDANRDPDDVLIELETWLRQCREAGVRAIPPDDPVMAYAESIGLTAAMLELHWWAFKRRRKANRQRGAKGWRQAFRNSVEGNWFRLWWVGDAGCQLTSVGLQTQRAMDAEQAGRGDDASGAEGEGA